jgi:glycosyltransferase involved in cell wall biosynthesis
VIGLRRQLRRLAPDILHYHLFASAMATRPKVHMVAGPLYLESPIIRAMERFLVRLDTVTIGGSEFTARLYRGLGRTLDRTPVIPYGVDTNRFQPMEPSVREGVRADLGIERSDFTVIMVAFVYAPKRAVHAGRGIKGHDVLLEAWRSFHADHPNSRLLLVGGGFDEGGERHRRNLVTRFRLDQGETGVTWIGTTTDVRRYYAAADVSVAPSLSENHGSALEAGAMGVPSIVSDVGALPEAVDSEESWLVPPGDVGGIVAALTHAYEQFTRGQLAARGSRARARVVRLFDSARAARKVADTIEQAADSDDSRSDSRVISLFTEGRFGRDATGRWAAIDRAAGYRNLVRYTFDCQRVRLVVRADHTPGTAQFTVPTGVNVAPLPYYIGGRKLLCVLPRLIIAVLREVVRADALIVRVPGFIGSLAALMARLLRRQYAVEVVGDLSDVVAAGTLGRGTQCFTRLAGAQMRWVVRGASASQFVTRTSLQQRYPPKPGSPTVSVSNVHLDSDSFVVHPRQWQPPPFHVMTIGSQDQHYKGHDVLLRALRQLCDDGIPVNGVVVGGGTMHREIVKLADELGIADRVTFTGIVHDRRRIIELLDSASLFALPSRTEGLPRALVEAMARGLPAVGSRVGGIPELIDRPWLVPVDDERALAEAIGELLHDKTAWEEQSKRNLDRAKQYELSKLEGRFHNWVSNLPRARRGNSCDHGQGLDRRV